MGFLFTMVGAPTPVTIIVLCVHQVACGILWMTTGYVWFFNLNFKFLPGSFKAIILFQLIFMAYGSAF